MHVPVMALVPQREMTEKQNTLQTLIRAVTSLFWNAPLRASEASKTKRSNNTKKAFGEYMSTCIPPGE